MYLIFTNWARWMWNLLCTLQRIKGNERKSTNRRRHKMVLPSMYQSWSSKWGSGEAHLRRAHLFLVLFNSVIFFLWCNSCVIIDVRPERNVVWTKQGKGKLLFDRRGVCLDCISAAVVCLCGAKKDGEDDNNNCIQNSLSSPLIKSD